MKKVLILASAVLLAACSPVMEATRPDPVDISQFVVGDKRIKILSEIGSPIATTQDGKNSCDVYKLYTTGPSAIGKGAIAAGEAVADVFTLGLAEVVLTPAEAATRGTKHGVVFCYSATGTLVSVNQSDNPSGE